MSQPLTPKLRTLALEWLRTGNVTASAVKAGYSAKTAAQAGSRALNNVKVQRFLAGRIAKAELEADIIIGEVARQAFEEIPDIGDLFDAQGNLRPLQELTIEQRRAISSVEVVKKNLAAGDGKTDIVHKLKTWNIRAERTKAQELLARLLKLVNNEPPAQANVAIFQINALPALTPDPPVVRELPAHEGAM